MSTRYVIYGAGAIGSGIGGHLFRTGHEVMLVGRPAHVAKIREEGLRLVTPQETYTLRVPAVAAAGDVGFRDGDVVLLCVKSQDTDAALVEIRAAGGDPQTLPILCCQNSIVNEPAALRYFRRVYGVLVVVPGVFLEPGVVHNPIRGNAGVLEVGRYPAGVDDLASDVVAALATASYEARPDARVMDAKGTKMLGNLGNAMGAITDGKGDSKAFMAQVREEAKACFAAAGISWEPEDVFQERMRQARGVTELPPGLRNLGSTWQSLQREQRAAGGAQATSSPRAVNVESDHLNGEIARLGRLHGIPTPHNEVLQEVSNAMAARGEAPGRYTAQDLEAIVRQRTG